LKPPTGRKPGGQPGHKRNTRELLPIEQVDHVVDLVPSHCERCQSPLSGRDSTPQRHQVTEVPPIKPVVTEYRRHLLECEKCAAKTRAALPTGVPEGDFGERLSALVCLLAGKFRLSKRLVQDLLVDVTGVDISLGAVSNVEQEMSQGLAAPVAEAVAFVQEQDIVHMDETGWFEGRADGRAKRAWLWVAATPLVSVFMVSLSRGSDVAKQLLGEHFTGFLCTDRWSAYNWFDVILRQVCWSHLTRDFEGFIDRGGEGARIGQALMAQRNRMFKWWHQVKDGTLPRETFVRRMRKVERTVGALLREAVVCAEDKTAGMAKEILKLEAAMWTFVQVPGLEPTNNFGERTIRHAVMWRKTSFGTQCPDGSRFVERILTAVTTLRQQKRNVLEYLTSVIHALRSGGVAPSLIPTAAPSVPRCPESVPPSFINSAAAA
jgi:transposase